MHFRQTLAQNNNLCYSFFVNAKTQTRTTKVILTFIHAGGAAKTCTTRDIGYELAKRGKRVLLVDLDPQANLSEWLGLVDVAPQETIMKALREYAPLPEPKQIHGMDVIPAHLELARTEVMLPALTNPEGRLKEALEPLRESGKYDYILLDAPPSLGKLTANGANAADWVIVPLPASPKGLSAISGVREMLTEYARTNKSLRVALYLATQGMHTKDSKKIAEGYALLFPNETSVVTMTHRPAVYSRAILEQSPVSVLDKDAAAEVAQVTDQLLAKMGDA